MVTALRDRVYDRVRLLGSPGKQVPLVIWQTCQVKPPPNPTRCCHKCCHGSYLETSRASKSKAFLCRISSDLSVVESDGAFIAGRCGVRLAFEIRSGLQDSAHQCGQPPGAGGLPRGGGDRERAREVTTRTAMVPCVGLGFVNFRDRLPRRVTVVRQACLRTIHAGPKDHWP